MNAGLADFRSAVEWRAWLARYHEGAKELVVRCWRLPFRDQGITYPEALDEALCYGWIDGVRRRVDDRSFSTRFTPRRSGSVWSAVNVRRVEELEAAGRMRAPGRAAFAARPERRTGVYSYEKRDVELLPAYVKRFRRDRQAWRFFQAQPAGYRRISSFWVMEAKREETRLRRLDQLIGCSAENRRIPLLAREKR